MINKKKMQIFDYLNNKEDYTTSFELSNLLNVSTKTINRHISDLNYYLKTYNIEIISSRGVGYKLIGDKVDISKVLKNFNSNINSFFYDDSYESRLNSIIKLFIMKKYITIDTISEKLNLSTSLVNKLISDLKEILIKYNLNINSKPYYGSYISGKEINIREFISDYAIKISDNKIKTNLTSIQDKQINIIEQTLISELKSLNLIIFDKDLNFLISKIIISIFRIQQSFDNEIENLNIEYKFHNYIVINNLITKLSSILNFKISQKEIVYILKYCDVIVNSYKEDYVEKNQLKEIVKVIDDALDDIYFISGINYKNDFLFIDELSKHIKRFLERNRENICYKNSLLKDIKTKYVLEFNIAFFLAKQINKDLKIVLNEDEIGCIAVYFALANKRLRDKKNKTICIICHYGLSTGQLLAEEIKQNIDNIDILNIYPVKYIDLAISKKPDLIISTVEIENREDKIFYVNNIFDKNIINDIKLALYKSKEIFDIKNNIFDKDSFFKIKVQNKEEIFEKIPTFLEERNLIENNNIKAILDRENISSTEIGNLVAIPHTIMENKPSIICVIILENPIMWDKQQVQLIFMIFFNPKEKYKFDIFKYLYNLVKNKDLINKILNVNDFESFTKLIYK